MYMYAAKILYFFVPLAKKEDFEINIFFVIKPYGKVFRI